MASFNTVFIIGNVTKDPEKKFTSSGQELSTFSMAINQWKDKEPIYIDVECWEKKAEICNKYIKKGSLIHIQGRLKNKKWEQDGQKRSKTIVILSDVQFLPNTEKNNKTSNVNQEESNSDYLPF